MVMKASDAKQAIEEFGQLKSKRGNWETHWQDIGEFFMPIRDNFTKRVTSGERLGAKAVDSTPIYYSELLANALSGLLTTASSPWFRLTLANTDLASDDLNKEWLESVEVEIRRALFRTNFYQEITESYSDLVNFGTQCMYVDEDDEDDLHFSTRHLSEIYVAEGRNGRVDVVYRSFKRSKRQLIEQFGLENLTTQVKREKDENAEIFEVLHCVKKRLDFDPEKLDGQNKQFMSVWLLVDGSHILKEGGFDEFPYVVSRWRKRSGEVYGRSQAMTALRTVRYLNAVKRANIRAKQKSISPPMVVVDDGVVGNIKMSPDGITKVRSMDEAPQPLYGGAMANALTVADRELEQIKMELRDIFFVDIILTQDGTQRTATEILQRTDERTKILLGQLGRLTSEMLDPIIARVYGILLRKGIIPPPPEGLEEQDFDIVYVSPLARAEHLSEVQGLAQAAQILTPIAQLQQLAPQLYDMYQFQPLFNFVNDTLGVPKDIRTGVAELQARAEAKAEQESQAAQMEQMAQGAETLKTASQAEKNVSDTDGPVNQAMEGLAGMMGGQPTPEE